MAGRRWVTPAVFLAALALYVRMLAPSVAFVFDDSLEFQLVGYKLAIAHPTGYPLYTLLLKLFAFLPVGDAAYRANLSSAVFAAMAVTFVYRIVLRLSGAPLPALAGAGALAISPVFWSQAVVAEVYALNAALLAGVIWLVVGDHPSPQPSPLRGQGVKPTTQPPNHLITYYALALLLGLGLAHHRTIVLLLPALALYALIGWRVASGERRSAIRKSQIAIRYSLLAFLLPLLLYLYIPLRGAAGSLDGRYQNTPEGFVRWVTAAEYNVFLTDNPSGRSYDAAFFANLFLEQFGWLGLGLAAIGFAILLRNGQKAEDGRRMAAFHRPSSVVRPLGLFLPIAFLSYLAFVLVYRAADVEVFAIPAFLLLAVALGCGLGAVLRQVAQLRGPLRAVAALVLAVLAGLNFVTIGRASLVQNDLSGKTEVRDYGRDMLAQPLPPGSVLVGILGEMTLVRYFQETEGLNPALVTVAADRDEERLAAIERALRQAQGAPDRPVFTTRPLNGLPERFALGALGPLVRVRPAPLMAGLGADAPRAGPLRYRSGGVTRPFPYLVRVQVSWQSAERVGADLKVSARLLDGERVVAQTDDWPVHNSYHTAFWRPGEVVEDVYDLRLPAGAPAGPYRVLLIIYRAESGAEVGRADLGMLE